MGAGLPREIITETDLSQYVDTLLKGISCVIGITERGPIGTPQLISSEIQFERVFGGELKKSDFPLLAKRALSYGAVLWVSRAAHYTDITRKSTLTAKYASVDLKDRQTTPENTLRVKASSQGVWGDNLKISVEASDLDPENLFDIRVFEYDTEVELLEDLSMDSDSADCT